MQLHHEIAGSGDTIVLIHAGIADSRMWEPQWRRYAEDYQVVRYDMRGFGQSPLPPEPYQHAQDLLDLLDRLEIERAALVGNSLGGRVALEATLARPQLVTALVLVGPGLPNAGWSDEVVAYGSEEVRLFMDGELDAAADLTVRFWVDGVGREPGEVDADLRRLVYDMQLRAYQHAQEGGDAAEELELVEDAGDHADEVPAPTLLVVGDHDQPDILRIAERLSHEIPGARLEHIADAAHVPSMERPQEFDRIVLGFLAEQL
jgi:pimeloyl-ACP methyl ester carboxylesterase